MEAHAKLALEYFVVALGLSGPLALAAEKLPTFPKNSDYDEARESLIALGWKPVPQSAQSALPRAASTGA